METDYLSKDFQSRTPAVTASANNVHTNLKQSCFICLKVDQDLESDFETHSLRFVCQYLKIPSDYLKQCEQNFQHNANSALSDFTVSLCFTCAAVHSKLVSLIRQLELTQLLINYQMQIYGECLKTPQTRSDSTFASDGTRVKLRKVFAEACFEEAKNISETLPKVLLERITIEKPTNLEISDGDSDYPNDIDMCESLSQDYSENDEAEELPRAKGNFKNITGSSMTQVTIHLWKQAPRPETLADCKSCQRIYSYHSRNFFEIHLATSHVEEVFEHQRLPHITKQQFAICCRHALNLQISRAKRIKGESYSIFCPICNYKTMDTFKLRAHLVIKHFQMVEQKIISLQKLERIENLSKINLPGTRNTYAVSKCENWERLKRDCKDLFKKDPASNKYKCNLCGRLAHISNPQGHLINEHPETLFKNCTMSNLTAKEFRSLCSNVLEIEVNKNKSTKEKSVRNKAFICYLCSTKLFARNNVRYHLASKHYKVLEEKLASRLEQSNACLKKDLKIGTQKCFESNPTVAKIENNVDSGTDMEPDDELVGACDGLEETNVSVSVEDDAIDVAVKHEHLLSVGESDEMEECEIL